MKSKQRYFVMKHSVQKFSNKMNDQRVPHLSSQVVPPLTSQVLSMRKPVTTRKKTTSELYVLIRRRYSLPLLLVYSPHSRRLTVYPKSLITFTTYASCLNDYGSTSRLIVSVSFLVIRDFRYTDSYSQHFTPL